LRWRITVAALVITSLTIKVEFTWGRVVVRLGRKKWTCNNSHVCLSSFPSLIVPDKLRSLRKPQCRNRVSIKGYENHLEKKLVVLDFLANIYTLIEGKALAKQTIQTRTDYADEWSLTLEAWFLVEPSDGNLIRNGVIAVLK
jgi:hypothetical protein